MDTHRGSFPAPEPGYLPSSFILPGRKPPLFWRREVAVSAKGGPKLACKLCAWICNWFCTDAGESFWKKADDWDRAQSNDHALWMEASEEDRECARAALAIYKTDPEAAFLTFLELAESGMPWAMETVADYYVRGDVVAADFEQAQDYYRRAIEAGSWMATIGYAKLLARHEHWDVCEAVLRDGVEQDFVPSFFWLAWYRLKRSGSAATRREVRPLLERAADVGHPAAAVMLARMKLLGKFGLREIPDGFRDLRAAIAQSRSDAPQPAEASTPQVQVAG